MILVAPDSYKGSYSSYQICDAIEKGIRIANDTLEVMKFPMSDGGDGALEVINFYLNSETIIEKSVDPLGRSITAKWLKLDRKAFIETAQASGLHLLNGNLEPLKSSSLGTGLQIKSAIERGCKEIYLTLGGSATNDAGCGILSALGAIFKDKNDNPIIPNGGNLFNIDSIDYSSIIPLIHKIHFTLATDVTNPLNGVNGAIRTFSRQKGASDTDIEILENGFRKYSILLKDLTDINVEETSGCGAAGGIPLSLLSLFNCNIQPGFNLIKDISEIEESVMKSDLVISGEGRMDMQTLNGKLPYRMFELAQKYGKKIVFYNGSTDSMIRSSSLSSVPTYNVTLINSVNGSLSDITKLVSETIKSHI